jgi:hypothetical protein
VIFALSAALYGGVTLDKGRIAQSSYNDVRPLRMNEAPRVITHVMPTDNAPGGMGEPPAAVIAPAVANAILPPPASVRQVPLQAGLDRPEYPVVTRKKAAPGRRRPFPCHPPVQAGRPLIAFISMKSFRP